jgi:hypothetical protein
LFNAINQYGKDNFIFEEVFHHDDTNVLIEREKQEIRVRDTYHNGMNCTEGGEGWGIKEPWNKGKTHSLETKETLRKVRSLNNHIVNSPEARRKKSQSMTGKKFEQAAAKRSATWLVTTPDDSYLVLDNLHHFCRQHKICAPAMINVAHGKLRQNHGYVCYKLSPGSTGKSVPCVPIPHELLATLRELFPTQDFSQSQLPLRG